MTTGVRPPVTASPLTYTVALAVVPHDTNELAVYAKALYIGVAGDVKLTTIEGYTVTFKAVPVGILPVTAKVVFSTGTTATNLTALA